MTALVRRLVTAGFLVVLSLGLIGAFAVPANAAALAGGIDGSQGTSVVVLPMGHLSTSANRFYETFTASPSGPWTLTTPTGVATNGGIVLASPSATAAAILPWYLLEFTAARSLVAGRAAGAGEVLPPLAAVPTSLSIARNGTVALLTRAGLVMSASSLAGPFRVATSLTALHRTTAGQRCDVTALTAVVAGPSGVDAIGATCRKPGVDAIFTRAGSGWQMGAATVASALSVVRLDAGADGSLLGLVATGTRHPTIVAGEVVGGRLRLGGHVPGRPASIRSTELVVAQGHVTAGYVVAATSDHAIRAGWLPVAGRSAWLGPELPDAVQAVALRPSADVIDATPSVTAFSVAGSIMRELTLTPSGARWVVTASHRVPIPYGTSQ